MRRLSALYMLGWLLCFSLVTACAIIPVSQSSAPPSPSPSTGGGKVGSSVTAKRAQFLMGTLVELTAVAPSDAIAQAALTGGFQEIRRLETVLSTWIESSELSRVNQAAGREPVGVSAETFELLRRALEVAGYTEGAFNIAIGPAVRPLNIPQAPRSSSK